MRPRIRMVYFDVGGTILTVRPSVGAIYGEALERLGHPVDVSRVEVQFREALGASAHRRREAGYVCSDELLRDEWRLIVRDSFRDLAPTELIDRAFEDLYERFRHVEAWHVAGGARETFHSLASAGVRQGILSNWDSRLPETLVALELDRHFRAQVISFRVGFEKPHPRIFEAAIEASEVSPHEILFVGDSYHCDIRPAREHGLHTLWIQDGPLPDPARPPGDGESGLIVSTFRDVWPVIRENFSLGR